MAQKIAKTRILAIFDKSRMAALKLTHLREESELFVYRTPQSIHIITSDFPDLGRQKER